MPDAEGVAAPPIADSGLVPLQGAINFRDLGGYRTPFGRTASGRIYRSDALISLTESDFDTLEKLGLRTVLDLRHPSELLRSPNVFADHHAVRFHSRPMVLDETWIPGSAEALGAMDMEELNREMVRGGGEAIALLFHLAADPESCPLVFHCRGGRDRTGLAAALLLLSAGVSEDDVVRDYLLSNQYMAGRFREAAENLRANGKDPADIIARLTLRSSYILAGIRLIEDRFGGIEQYLETVGITSAELAHFRAHFVQPAP